MAEESALGKVTVLEHPALTDGPVQFEALPPDLKEVLRGAVRAAVIDWQPPGGGETVHLIVPLEVFDAAAKQAGGMEAVLRDAPSAKVARKASTDTGRDYTSPEFAGLVHRGKVTDEEAEYVRNNLEAVNANRARQDPPQPPIDPTNPDHAKRYGFPEPGPAPEPAG
jgi:hypothetical protein